MSWTKISEYNGVQVAIGEGVVFMPPKGSSWEAPCVILNKNTINELSKIESVDGIMQILSSALFEAQVQSPLQTRENRDSENRLTEVERQDNGYIYLIKNQTTGVIKIGRTTQPAVRLKRIKTQFEKAVMIALFNVDDSVSYEAKLHKDYKVYHLYNEWFELPATEIENIIAWFENRGIINEVSP